MKRHILALKAALTALLPLALAACQMDDGDHIVKSELGSPELVYTVGAQAGEFGIPVLTDQHCLLSLVDDGQSWLKLKTSDITGDDTVSVQFADNAGFPRLTRIRVFAPDVDRADTITIRQDGVKPYIRFTESNRIVKGTGETFNTGMETNIPADSILTIVRYTDGAENHDKWISRTAGQGLTLKADPNPADNKLRHASISFVFTDSWGQQYTSTLYLTQQTSLNKLGAVMSFTDLRKLDGQVVDGDYILTGYVISDGGNLNVAGNPNSTKTKISYKDSKCTAYIESLDGKYGLKLKTASKDDNVFERGTKVDLLINGCTVTKESNPDRYTLSGVTSAMIATKEEASLPVKKKHLKDLTDDDIYTLVTLEDCELPVRKGSFTPVNEGYTPLFKANRVSKYAMLFRDVQGSSAYMMINTNVTWRRTGETLPYGRGSITGIIVNETNPRFHWNDTGNEETYGQIGRYAIRPLDRSDIAISSSFSSGFSRLVTEYRWMKPQSNTVLLPTTGTGKLYLTNGERIYSYVDWSYLGPCGMDDKGNKNGFGIDDPNYHPSGAAANGDGKGMSHMNDMMAWRFRTDNAWNEAKGRGEGWCVEFSTTGCSGQLSMQLGLFNQSLAAPVYWEAQYSLTGNQDGDDWVTVKSFSVPAMVAWSNTQLWQTNAFMYIDIPLPKAINGHSKVFIRIIAASDKAGSATSYDGAKIGKSTLACMNYLAIRTNK